MNKDYKLNVSEIFASLCRHLSSTNDINRISKEFMGLKSNLARVEFASTLLSQRNLIPNYDTTHWKNDELSNKYKDNGNEVFRKNKDEYALELYTKSIAYATPLGESLGFAYGNRSAVLCEKMLFKECAQDIYRAYDCNVPVRTFEKLTTRLDKAEHLQEYQVDIKSFEDLPAVGQDCNPYIACAVNAVAINNTPELGRHVIATKDILIGQVIAIEKPFAAIVLPDSSINHCHHCLKLAYNLIPCDKCSFALFCDKKCSDEASKLYHKYECPIIEVLLTLQISKLSLLALRVTICARKDYNNIYKFPRKNTIYESGRYEEIHDLISNSKCRSNADLFDRAVTAAIIYELVKKYTEFFDELKGDKYKEIFMDLLLHHMQTAPSNFHEVSELVSFPEDLDRPDESTEIGAGAYSFLSMLNHSCCPNVVRHCHGSTIVLRALSPIRKGQELLDNYGYHYAVMPKAERQKNLKAQYFFDCICEACTKDWPMYHDLPIKNFEFEVSEDDVKKLQERDVVSASVILKSLLIKAAILDKIKPCKNLADLQECIKQCYCILGNKKVINVI